MFILKIIIGSIVMYFLEDVGVLVRFLFFKLIGKDVDFYSFYDKEDTDMVDKQSWWNILLGFITVGFLISGIYELSLMLDIEL